MTQYRKFMHVERLEKSECDGLLQNDAVYITAKVDGTNCVIWYDQEKKKVCGGSRTRQLSEFSDNAGFYQWLTSDFGEAVSLRKVVEEHPNWIVYGEWLGFAKFIGQIKTYNQDAKGHVYIFDVFDVEDEDYMPDPEWRAELAKYDLEPYFVELLAVLDHPTYEDIAEVAKSNKFLLDYAEHPGEGVVCKVPHWRNSWGHNIYGKLVLEEFKQRQGTPKKKQPQVREGLESDIVDYWVTEAELTKAKAKVCVALDVDEFDKKSGKHIGYFMEIVWQALMDEMGAIVKQNKNPIIDFRLLRNASNIKARKFLGLI